MLESIFEQLHFTIPYRIIKGCNKTTLRHFRLQKGVYFIKEGPEIVYVGMSQSCVYKALYRHFERWNDWRISRQVYLEQHHHYSVAIYPCEDSLRMEREFIKWLTPRDNRELYEWDETKWDMSVLANDENVPF